MPTLDFKGKQHIYAHHLTVPYRPLIPDSARSLNAGSDEGNLIIHGDNLDALKALLPRYAGRVKCVYIDPPYNTGNEGWSYNDKVNSPLMREWLKRNGQVDREDLERHDKWLCMMWPRLHLLKELLSEDGAIFVSIDDNELHHLRMTMDEIFGEENFFAVLTRRAMHTVRNSSKDFNSNADYVLAYAKEKSWFSSDKDRYIRYITDKSAAYPHDDGDGRGKYKLDPIHARNYYEPYEFEFENGERWSAAEGQIPCLFRRYIARNGARQPPGPVGERASGQALPVRSAGRAAAGYRPLPRHRGFQRERDAGAARDIRRRRGFPATEADEAGQIPDGDMRSKDAHRPRLLRRQRDHGARRAGAEQGGRRQPEIHPHRSARTMPIRSPPSGCAASSAGVPGARDSALRAGLGGSFAWCALGAPVGIEAMLNGEGLPSWPALAAWLLHTASGVSAGPGGP